MIEAWDVDPRSQWSQSAGNSSGIINPASPASVFEIVGIKDNKPWWKA
jgi:hypothetical protein